MHGRLYTTGPPTWDPGAGRAFYLPEDFHFSELSDGVVPRTAARMTARCIAQWADRFSARTLSNPTEYREGGLEGDLLDREELIDELFAWLETRVPLYLAGLSLSLKGEPLLEQSDGIPGVLAISPDQFALLQVYWVTHGLPTDLYYPATELRTVIEPVRMYGGIVRASQHYSPRRWERRKHVVIDTTQVPTEEQRKSVFVESCSRFMEALMLRMAEISEPGKESDTEKMEMMRKLAQMTSAMLRHEKGDEEM